MKKIQIHRQRRHSKASERYVDVTFYYDNNDCWDGSIPIEYRRTGTDLSSQSDIDEYVQQVYKFCDPQLYPKWRQQQQEFWLSKQKATVTKSFFDALTSFQWTCVNCQLPPNPNWARRIQDLKEMGYTIATDTTKQCKECGNRNTHIILVPLPRGGISGYETWSPSLRKRIVNLLNGYDVYENRLGKKENLLPDHKFPEIRWGSYTKRDSLEDLTDQEIIEQFQLLSNQRNQQKREVCRQCYQTGIRGFPFGIKYYYLGNEQWDTNIPKSGQIAEQGCIGCGWYDLQKWRISLNNCINNLTIND